MSAATSSPSIFSTLAAKAKAHHESVNAAYTTYYGAGSYPAPSQPTSRRPSAEMTLTDSKSPSAASKAWKSLKKHAKEHHESMNAAYGAYYGSGAPSLAASRNTSAATSPRHSGEMTARV
ncbi:hypothetical protein B0J11DRAFT_335676 [Dendryphion nanum]|uniref:Uncharacterized protein n=1 Tax=Dendryphion nanum TaxID=256645 RepID=A0A9P9DMM9_9PLEO|nr:hypothetical protein B0J11DRAFT_335676 [Dendryphion nanum]